MSGGRRVPDRTESRGMGLRYLEIKGGVPLCGEIEIQGSKNAVLPVLAACMLGEGTCTIENCPMIGDVYDSLEIMKKLGCRIRQNKNTVRIDASDVCGFEIGGAEAARIRSSILFLGALLGRMKKAVLPLPGGCAIGRRPIDLHLNALEQLGAVFTVKEKIMADGGRLHGGRVRLAMPSVGATENMILASVQAAGETLIENAAREPEIDELCAFLKLRGADISRQEDGSIRIRGTEHLKPVVYKMGADRIVTGTYLLAAAATNGIIRIRNFPDGELDCVIRLLERMGAGIKRHGSLLELWAEDGLTAVPHLDTAPFPGFPTDLQSPLMAVLCGARGKSCICENIFESRFRTAGELRKMGAQITVDGRCAWIEGETKLHGALLWAPDLRGGAALVLAGLQTPERTLIGRVEYIERGYEDICRDLKLLGADIRMLDGETQ